MKICALTMVYKDHWALSKWYAHFAAALGAQNLFIVAHGADPHIQALCPDATIITVPRDTLAGFDRMRGHMLNSFQDALGIAYDWVIRTDADELIALDPDHYDSFGDLFARTDTSHLFALGLNVLGPNEGVFSGHYSKAWAVKRGTHLIRHGVRTRDDAFYVPHGVYLAHLKFADPQALATSNDHRATIAGGSEEGLPGRAWREARRTSERFLDRAAALPLVAWDAAARDAHTQVAQEPVREGMILRAKSIDFDTRVALPDWFSY